MNAYRTQQQFRAKIADLERQQREICKQYGLHIVQNEPERSGTTGHDTTLTPRRKCGIIKAIRRHVRRAKKARRAKTMKCYEFGFYADSGEFFEIRENGFEDGRKYYVAANSAEKAYSEFVGALDEEYCGDEMTVREIPTGHDMADYVKL